jgi:hypothetical protein
MINEHLWSNAEDAEAWLVDGFGAPHRLAAVSMIGRDRDHEMVVLSDWVSREHAELKKNGATWTVRDLGSRNHTYVDNVMTKGRVQLPERCIVRLGKVSMWFLQHVEEEPVASASLETEELASTVVFMTLDAPRAKLRAVGNTDVGTGGTLMSQARDATEWVNHKLAPQEFQLLRILFTRAMAEASSPAIVKGCVPTKQLVRDLPWQSDFADEENVRSLVKRLRKVLWRRARTASSMSSPDAGTTSRARSDSAEPSPTLPPSRPVRGRRARSLASRSSRSSARPDSCVPRSALPSKRSTTPSPARGPNRPSRSSRARRPGPMPM